VIDLIHPCTSVEEPGWLEMREALWPHASRVEHLAEMASLLAEPGRYGQFVARAPDGEPCGFAEAAIRTDYVNGTSSSPVAFLEGVYVSPGHRLGGMARALVEAVQQWARARGCRELASDSLLDNAQSHAMHRALGFEETERVVYFRKELLPDLAGRPALPTAVPAGRAVTVRTASTADAAAIAHIYNHYILHTIVTFEEAPLDGAEMARRMDAVRAASHPWLVAEADGRIAGYAYAGPWKARIGYRYTVEISAYLDPQHTGRGTGSALYARLFELLMEGGMRCVIGGIALPNDGSVALHEKFGMRKVAHFERNGIKFGRWIDVGYWQRLLPEDAQGSA
jgi:L-amino acid N-acyltransferase YncA